VDAAVRSVFDRGWFILGPAVERFESEFAAYCGVDHGVGVASGTEALQLALLAAGAAPGDEVITVANTAVPTVAAIRAAGCVPVFVEVDAASYTMDPSRLEAAITSRTRAVVPVHLYGQCADMDPILAVASQNGLTVVEDACQAHGAEHRGRRAGSMGDFGCFSFYPTKNLGACGDAGMVVTRHAEAADRVRRLRNYGQASRDVHVEEGINSRLDDLQAAVLSTKLSHLDAWNQRRRELGALYAQLLADTPLVLPSEAATGRHVFHLYVVRTGNREEFRQFLAEAGVGTQVHYPQPVYRHAPYERFAPAEPLRLTESYARQLVTLPLFPELQERDVARVAAVVRTAVDRGLISREGV
jgi:dTDP-4-amino-4,6-dideoxygalactose transaminase